MLFLLFTAVGHTTFPESELRPFELAWGINPAQAEAALWQSQKDYSALRFSPEELPSTAVGTAPETEALRRRSVLRYETRLPAFYNLPAVVHLTFYNPAGTTEGLALSKVEVRFTLEEKDCNWVTMGRVFSDLTTLLKARYGIAAIEQPSSDRTLSRRYETAFVTVALSVGAEDLLQEISCEKNDLSRKARARQLELDAQASGTTTVIAPPTTTKTQTPIGFSFSAEACWTPFIYSAFENSHGSGLDLFLSAGLPLPPVRLGGTLYCQYASFDGLDPATTFHGAWAILGLAGFIEFRPLDRLTVHGGVGAGWLASSFEYRNMGVERLDEAGLMFDIAAAAAPLDWLTVKIPLRLHLFFGKTRVSPLFYAGARAESRLFTWLNLFVELGLETWNYSGVFSTAQGLFIMTTGARLAIE